MKKYITEIKKLQERVDELIKKNEKMDKEIISLMEQRDELPYLINFIFIKRKEDKIRE